MGVIGRCQEDAGVAKLHINRLHVELGHASGGKGREDKGREVMSDQYGFTSV